MIIHKKASMFLLVAVVFGSMGLFSGCSEEDPIDDNQAYLQQSFYNLIGIESMRYEVALELAAENSGGLGVDIDFGMNGAFSGIDPENEGNDLTMVLKAKDADGRDYRFDVSMKDVGGDVYIRLLDLPEIPDYPSALFSSLVGPLWKIEGDSGGNLARGFTVVDGFGTADASLDELEMRKRQMILDYVFFKDIEFVGTEDDDDGRPVYRYSVVLDEGQVDKYMAAKNAVDGVDAELAEGELFSDMGFEGDVFVDVETATLVGLEGEVSLTDSEGEVSILDTVVMFSDLNQAFYVEVPTDYEVFDLAVFLGAFMEAGIMGE